MTYADTWKAGAGSPRGIAGRVAGWVRCVCALAAMSVAGPLLAESITVAVSDLGEDAEGLGHFALYDSPAGYDARDPVKRAKRPIDGGTCTWTTESVPPGEYVVSFFADLNGNGRLDRTQLGIPREPIALSNNSRPRFGPPRYQQMVFAHADSPTTQDLSAFLALGKRGRFGIGVGAIINESPYQEGNPRVTAIPMITYMGDRLSITGPVISYLLANIGPATIRGRMRYSFDGFDTDDADALQGMHKRNDTVMAGASVRANAWAERLDLQLDAETDVLNEHGGQTVSTGVGYSFRIADVSLSTGVGLEWVSARTADHLYGVRASEKDPALDRPAYEPGAAVNASVRLGLRYSVTDGLAFISSAGWTRFDDVIRKSPIVQKDGVFSVFFALAYSL
mgnify:CR=1 FL=1